MSSQHARRFRSRSGGPGRYRFRKLLVETLESRNLLAVLPPAGLVSWYRAEGDGTDSAGSNNGVLENGTTFTAGKVGQAFFFDGVDDRVSVPDIDDSLEPGSNFTVEAWVNPSSSGHGRPIAEKRAGNGNSFTFETTHAPYAPNDGLQFVVWIGGVQQNFLQTPVGVLQNNIWQHVAATYDGAALRIFVDGVEKASSSVSGAIDLSSAPLAIGLNSVAAFAWHGAIDEVSFYSRALSQAEVQSIVAAGSEGKDPNAALIVTTTADSGSGSLRAAIEFANANPGIDSISFAIPGDGPHTISPLSPLPIITDPVEIDGYTQPGTTFNETFDGLDTVLMIELDGSLAGQAHGLVVAGGDSTITGLAIHSFAGDGIRLESEDNLIAGNFIGTDISGTLDRGNGGHGVAVIGPVESITPIYSNDFENTVGSEWSATTTSVTPIGGRQFLGELGSETATLTIPASSILQGTTALTVSFDLFVIRTWDGNHTGTGSGPDRFQLTLQNGLNLIDTTFSNNVAASGFAGQAYPGAYGSGQFDPLTGASEIDTLGYEFGEPMDSVYRPSVTFSYMGGDVVLNFTGVLTTPGPDESWGLDNVDVEGIMGGFSAAKDFSFASNPGGAWSYGWTTSLGSTLNLYPDNSLFREGQLWTDNAIAQIVSPNAFYNPTEHLIDDPRHLPKQLAFHPGPSGERSVIRWTAASDDEVAVSALFTGADLSTTTDVHVLHNGVSLFDGIVNRLHAGPAFASTLSVTAGDSIDFVVGDGGNGYIGDSTALDAVIYSSSNADADDNEIGGTSAAARNVIAFNGGDGIHVAGSDSSATILNNFIFANDGLGIDLAGGVEDTFGVTANDDVDDDDGPSGLQNAPEVVSFSSFEDELAIIGVLHSSPSEVFRIELFASESADPSGHGEGRRLIGVRQVTTDASGHIQFAHQLPGVPDNTWITMTATDASSNTSEFSPAVLIGDQSQTDLEITISDSPDPAIVGEPLTYTIVVTNHGPADATGVVVSASAPDSTDFNSVMVPFGDLPSGETRTLQIKFTPQSVGTFQATASVIGGEDDPDSGNNSATESTVVEPNTTIELAAAGYEVSEGDGTVILTVRRTGGLNTAASVEFTTVGGTAGQRGITAGLVRTDDFMTTSGTLYFRPRSNVATIRVPIRDDDAIEGDETFQVVLSNPSDDARLGEIATATVTIHDDDPSLAFTAGSSQIVEGNGRLKTFAIPVKLSNAITRPVTVTYTVTGGTAVVNEDFRPMSGTLTFRPRVATQSIPLQIIGDAVHELDETVIIELSNPINAFLGATTRHRVTITNDDPQPPPPDPGSTPATSLAIDLQTLPRQSYSQFIARTDIETFRVELGANEQLILDVDPAGLGAALPSSTLTMLADDGVTVLATVGASAEPEGGKVTNNPATLFQADADGGTYFIRLATTAGGRGYGYSLHLHRIGVSEEVPHPELLNVPGPMYAWFDGVDTVGITGPTGYGFTLDGPWQQTVTSPLKSALRSQTLFLPSGSQFTMKSPQGVELPLLANGPILITTAIQRWGNIVGRVTTQAIDFPVSLAIAPINDLLADAIGSEFVALGLLSGQWRISLGATVLHAGRNTNAPVDETLAGIPYLRQKGPINFNANLGGFSLDYSVIETPIEWIFDPADPMLYVKADKVGDVKEAALAVSLHGLIEFKPQDAPNPLIDAGVTEFFGHVYATAKIPFQIGPLPMEVEAEIVANIDADRDGKLLGDLRDVDELFDVLEGDFSEVREIINDVQLGANGTLIMTLQQKKEKDTIPAGTYTMEAGRASVVLDGLAETIWVRAQQGGDVISPEIFQRLNTSSSIVTEGLITWDGDFLLSSTTNYSAAGINFEYGFTITQDGIFARIKGSADWSVRFDYGVGQVNGKAIAEIEANVAIEFDDDGDVHLSGSISARGRLRFNGNDVFKGSIEASVRSKGLRFRFPRGVGTIDLDLF